MSLIHQIDLNSLKDQKATFWTLGNKPNQALYGLSYSDVLLHLKSLYLLSDKVIGAASFYFESSITRKVVDEIKPLFKSGDIAFFVDEEIENFTEHGLTKRQKSPSNFAAYKDREAILRYGGELDSLNVILRRPPLSISDRIVELWIQDVQADDFGTLGLAIKNTFPNERLAQSIKNKCVDMALSRRKDFVWEYIRPKLKKLDLNEYVLRLARKKLSQLYCKVTSEYLGMPTDMPIHSHSDFTISSNSHYDITLFLECMETINVLKSLRDLDTFSLIELKKSSEFIYFREFYFLLIQATCFSTSELKIWLPMYRDAAHKYSMSEITHKNFLQAFKIFCSLMPKRPRAYERPLDFLLHTYDIFNRLPIEEFVIRFKELSSRSVRRTIEYDESLTSTMHPIFHSKEMEAPTMQSNLDSDQQPENIIFISYSHKDERWLKRLQVHLKPLEDIGLIRRWDDTCIEPGSKWREDIKNGLNIAKGAILLISADFLASEFITKNELPPLLEAAELNGTLILPIIVSPCRFSETSSISKFQPVNPPSRPIVKMSTGDQEETFLKVAKALEKRMLS